MRKFNYAKNKGPFRSIICVIIAAILITVTCFATVANADNARKSFSSGAMNKQHMAGTNIASVNVGSPSNLNEFGKDASQLGMNAIFGCSDRSFVYGGEVISKDGPDGDKWKDYPSMSDQWLYNSERAWYLDYTDVGGANLKWDKDSDTNDIHAMNLCNNKNTFIDTIIIGAANAGFAIFSGINMVFAAVLNMIINISNFDINSIVNLFQGNAFNLSDTLTHLFIQADGSLSPVLIIAGALFIIGLAVLVIGRVVKGNVSAMALISEFAILLLAALLCAICLTGSNTRLTSILSNFSTRAINAISNSGGGGASDAELWVFHSDDQVANAARDSNNTQAALCSKVYINLLIQNQFGYSVNDLYLWGNNGASEKNWGLSEANVKQIVSSLTKKDGENPRGEDLFAISNRKDGKLVNKGAPNLGYWWYAACSTAAPDHPYDIEDNKIVVKNGDTNASLYITDFLAAVDSWDDKGSVKAQQIMSRFRNPIRDVGLMLMCCLVTAATAFAISFAAIYALFGKVIFNVGALFIPVVPILLLIPFGNLRSTTKDLIKGWLIAALKMIIGQVFIVLVITVSAALCQNALGMFVDIIFLIAVGVKGPKIFQMINDALSRHEPGFMRTFDRGYNKAAQGLSNAWNPRDSMGRINKLKEKFGDKGPGENDGSSLAGESDASDKLNNIGDDLSNSEKAQLEYLDTEEARKQAGIDAMNRSQVLKANGITDSKYLDMIEKDERIKEGRLSTKGKFSKVSGAMRTAVDAVSRNKIVGAVSKVPLLGAGVTGMLKGVDVMANGVDKVGSLSNVKGKITEAKLGIFERTHKIDDNGNINRVGVKEGIRKAFKHNDGNLMFNVEEAKDKMKDDVTDKMSKARTRIQDNATVRKEQEKLAQQRKVQQEKDKMKREIKEAKDTAQQAIHINNQRSKPPRGPANQGRTKRSGRPHKKR